MDCYESFANYFKSLISFYNERYGTLPTVSYNERINKELLTTVPDSDGEVQWLPINQSEIDFGTIDRILNFSLNGELRSYYGSFYFLTLAGKLGNVFLRFYPIDGSRSLADTVLLNYQDAQFIFPDTECFLIGNAIVEGNDSFFIYYDNKTASLFCYEDECKTRIVLSGGLAGTIRDMEVCD